MNTLIYVYDEPFKEGFMPAGWYSQQHEGSHGNAHLALRLVSTDPSLEAFERPPFTYWHGEEKLGDNDLIIYNGEEDLIKTV
jgi:hypothetical protein